MDPTHNAVYWHKDDALDFYGEVWSYDNTSIFLRQGTVPHFPPPFDPPSAPWDARPDKFRLYAAGQPGESSRLPGVGPGRMLAPVHFDTRWKHRGNITTYLCRNWSAFESGTCALYQANFADGPVTVVELNDSFSTVFDGEVNGGKYDADPELRSLQAVRVINQEMSGTTDGPVVSRERFFFARLDNGTGLGIVRWDASTPNASASDGFTVRQRTVGLRLTCKSGFNSSGFPQRAEMDHI